MSHFLDESIFKGRRYTDAEIMEIQNAAVEGVRKYATNVEQELAQAKRLLSLAESFIPFARRDEYALLRIPYGGSE